MLIFHFQLLFYIVFSSLFWSLHWIHFSNSFFHYFIQILVYIMLNLNQMFTPVLFNIIQVLVPVLFKLLKLFDFIYLGNFFRKHFYRTFGHCWRHILSLSLYCFWFCGRNWTCGISMLLVCLVRFSCPHVLSVVWFYFCNYPNWVNFRAYF